MKKCLLVVPLVLVSVILFAQNTFSIGPVAGFGHTWLSNVEGNARYKPSGSFGAQLYFNATENISIDAGLIYSIEGGENRISNSTYSLRLNYLRFPVQFAYLFGKNENGVRPKLAFGPSVGFLLGGKQMLNSSESDVGDDYKSVDFGFQANGGIHVRLVSGVWLTMDISYYTGVLDNSETALTNKNRNISFNAGLLFGSDSKK